MMRLGVTFVSVPGSRGRLEGLAFIQCCEPDCSVLLTMLNLPLLACSGAMAMKPGTRAGIAVALAGQQLPPDLQKRILVLKGT